ncbi:MAG: hypothetical protein ACP5F2_01855 [Athalassotoga sp.]|uniref:hypothetical protein n=1 Tax=Athalassotoga sp. TaxID=2022597 RepID=UPI003D047DD1
MILSGVLAGFFLYFAISFFHFEWTVWIVFVIAEILSLIFHKGIHFRTSQITFIFLYLIIFLLWAKEGISLAPQFIYLLSFAVISFVLSDLFLKLFFKISGWTLVGITIFLLMYERFGSMILAIIICLIVIPIALRDREHAGNKNRSV